MTHNRIIYFLDLTFLKYFLNMKIKVNVYFHINFNLQITANQSEVNDKLNKNQTQCSSKDFIRMSPHRWPPYPGVFLQEPDKDKSGNDVLCRARYGHVLIPQLIINCQKFEVKCFVD